MRTHGRLSVPGSHGGARRVAEHERELHLHGVSFEGTRWGLKLDDSVQVTHLKNTSRVVGQAGTGRSPRVRSPWTGRRGAALRSCCGCHLPSPQRFVTSTLKPKEDLARPCAHSVVLVFVVDAVHRHHVRVSGVGADTGIVHRCPARRASCWEEAPISRSRCAQCIDRLLKQAPRNYLESLGKAEGLSFPTVSTCRMCHFSLFTQT